MKYSYSFVFCEAMKEKSHEWGNALIPNQMNGEGLVPHLVRNVIQIRGAFYSFFYFNDWIFLQEADMTQPPTKKTENFPSPCLVYASEQGYGKEPPLTVSGFFPHGDTGLGESLAVADTQPQFFQHL